MISCPICKDTKTKVPTPLAGTAHPGSEPASTFSNKNDNRCKSVYLEKVKDKIAIVKKPNQESVTKPEPFVKVSLTDYEDEFEYGAFADITLGQDVQSRCARDKYAKNNNNFEEDDDEKHIMSPQFRDLLIKSVPGLQTQDENLTLATGGGSSRRGSGNTSRHGIDSEKDKQTEVIGEIPATVISIENRRSDSGLQTSPTKNQKDDDNRYVSQLCCRDHNKVVCNLFCDSCSLPICEKCQVKPHQVS